MNFIFHSLASIKIVGRTPIIEKKVLFIILKTLCHIRDFLSNIFGKMEQEIKSGNVGNNKLKAFALRFLYIYIT